MCIIRFVSGFVLFWSWSAALLLLFLALALWFQTLTLPTSLPPLSFCLVSVRLPRTAAPDTLSDTTLPPLLLLLIGHSRSRCSHRCCCLPQCNAACRRLHWAPDQLHPWRRPGNASNRKVARCADHFSHSRCDHTGRVTTCVGLSRELGALGRHESVWLGEDRVGPEWMPGSLALERVGGL